MSCGDASPFCSPFLCIKRIGRLPVSALHCGGLGLRSATETRVAGNWCSSSDWLFRVHAKHLVRNKANSVCKEILQLYAFDSRSLLRPLAGMCFEAQRWQQFGFRGCEGHCTQASDVNRQLGGRIRSKICVETLTVAEPRWRFSGRRL